MSATPLTDATKFYGNGCLADPQRLGDLIKDKPVSQTPLTDAKMAELEGESIEVAYTCLMVHAIQLERMLDDARVLLGDVDRHLNIVATERNVALRNSAFDVIREAVAEYLEAHK